MMQDLFKFLPPEIITNILLGLPIDAIASSKCVCKPWRDLLDTDYFLKSHLSKSVPFMALITLKDMRSSCFQALEFEDEDYDVESSDLRYSQVTKFVFPERATIVGSVNGLLLLSRIRSQRDTLFICNPITRCFVEIPGPNSKQGFSRPSPPYHGGGAYGFGVSRISGEFKVVWISPKLEFPSESKCRVRTLGARSWRNVEASRASLLLKLNECVFGAFLDGNLHWTVTESSNMDKPLITCFDLETECFSSFGAPALRGGLSVLDDCLCFCEWKDGIVVWLMKEYGVEKSWSKDYVIAESAVENGCRRYNDVFPIKVFENGDVLLMLLEDMCLRYYFNKTKTFWDYRISGKDCGNAYVSSMLFTPSFQTLQGLGMNVIPF